METGNDEPHDGAGASEDVVPDPVAVRRLGRLEAATGGVTLLVSLTVAGHFVARAPLLQSASWGLLAGTLSAVGWVLVRRQVPASPTMAGAVGAGADTDADADTEDDGGWDASGLLLALLLVPPVVVLGILLQNWPLLLVTGIVAAVADQASWGGAALAVGTGLTALLVLELLVAVPLMRRWGMEPG